MLCTRANKFSECKGVRHGVRPTFTSHVAGFEVCCHVLSEHEKHRFILNLLSRDPSQHSTLKEQIEHQSTALYSTARLWDDGIIKPTDTRDVVGLGLALSARQRLGSSGRTLATTWDGDGKGFGVFRM